MSGLIAKAENKPLALVEQLAENGLHATGWGTKELLGLPDAQREALVAALAKHDVVTSLGVNLNYFAEDADAVKRETDAVIENIEKLAKPMRVKICSTGINRNYHHFSRDMPVAKQIDKLSQTMAPLAKYCKEKGMPLAIHTVCHYGADFAELCSRTPGLGLLFDTANCFLIGEPPLQTAEACAPYIVATHFKDSYVSPSFSPTGIVSKGAVLGQGDANLREIYKIILKKTPNPNGLVMEMEIDPVEDAAGQRRDQREVLAENIAFLRSL